MGTGNMLKLRSTVDDWHMEEKQAWKSLNKAMKSLVYRIICLRPLKSRAVKECKMPKAQYKHKTNKRYRKRNVSDRFWEKVNIKDQDECWEWQASLRHGFGYGQFSFNGYPEFAHRVAWVLTNGNIPKDKIVCHKCDNPLCVNPFHLFLGDQLKNIHDMISKERDALIGVRNPRSKLNDVDVKKARSLRKKGMSYNNIGKLFNVSRQTITDAITYKTWGHVK